MTVALRCRVCETVAQTPAQTCERCDGPTDFAYDWQELGALVSRDGIAAGPPTMWRYATLLPIAPPAPGGPGWTPLVEAQRLSESLGVELHLKLETANPTLSFKDRMAAIAVAAALEHGMETLCCSSTGNLGDAVASQAAAAGLEAIVLAPEGEDTTGVTARSAGAQVLVVDGTYDDCRRLELELAELFPWGFLADNLHAYAAEGAKTIAYEIAEQLDWELPDAVVCPAASGALLAKVAQGFAEVGLVGLSGSRLPQLFGAQAEGSGPIAAAFADDRSISRLVPSTRVASLAVGNPLYGELAIGAARASGGSIAAVPDAEIVAETWELARLTGITADYAGGAALAALRRAVASRELARGSRVVLVVTGTGLKPQPLAPPEERLVAPTIEAVLTRLGLDG
jgi:threonine synthase